MRPSCRCPGRRLRALGALAAAALSWGCDECETSRDCGAGQACIDGACESAGTFDADADGDADADADADTDADADADADLDWIAIPGGTFQMGSTDPGTTDAQPVHEVTVADFDMTRSEVTVLQYAQCVAGGSCDEPVDILDRNNWDVEDHEHYPVNYVTWDQAVAFCGWAGGRLPSEAEWEYAARNLGQDVTYPWGDEEPTCDLAIIDPEDETMGCGEGQSVAVCSTPAGNTGQGLCDMSGNVHEWTADHWHDDYQSAPTDGSAWIDEPEVTSSRALRGGGYQQGPSSNALRAADRTPYVSTMYEPDLGFRCARDGT